MVDKRILDYLKKYRSKYPLGALRQKIISSGYSSGQVDAAIKFLESGKVSPKLPVAKPVISKPISQVKPSGVVSTTKVASKVLSKVSQSKVSKPEINKDAKDKKSPRGKIPWMKVAGIFGFVILFFFILQIVSEILSSIGVSLDFLSNIIFGIALSLVGFVAFLLFYLGFVKLGRYTGSKLLRTSALMIIIFEILFIVLLAILWVVAANMASTEARTISDLAIGELGGITDFGITSSLGLGDGPMGLIISLVLILLVVVTYILFSIGLIGIGNKVKFAKLSGILNLFSVIVNILVFGGLTIIGMVNPFFIVGLVFNVWLLIIISGLLSLLGLSTILFESLCLIKASKQFE